MSELYTIDKTPYTELEKFQALRIEALEKDRERMKTLLLELKTAMENYTIGEIEVISETVEP